MTEKSKMKLRIQVGDVLYLGDEIEIKVISNSDLQCAVEIQAPRQTIIDLDKTKRRKPKQ